MRLHFSPASTTLGLTQKGHLNASARKPDNGAVAQSVERSPEKAGVGGSIPPCPTCKLLCLWTPHRWLKLVWCPQSVPRPKSAAGQTQLAKVMVERGGWVFVILVLEWYTKELVGYSGGDALHGQVLVGGPCLSFPWSPPVRPENLKLFIHLTFFVFVLMLD